MNPNHPYKPANAIITFAGLFSLPFKGRVGVGMGFCKFCILYFTISLASSAFANIPSYHLGSGNSLYGFCDFAQNDSNRSHLHHCERIGITTGCFALPASVALSGKAGGLPL